MSMSVYQTAGYWKVIVVFEHHHFNDSVNTITANCVSTYFAWVLLCIFKIQVHSAQTWYINFRSDFAQVCTRIIFHHPTVPKATWFGTLNVRKLNRQQPSIIQYLLKIVNSTAGLGRLATGHSPDPKYLTNHDQCISPWFWCLKHHETNALDVLKPYVRTFR